MNADRVSRTYPAYALTFLLKYMDLFLSMALAALGIYIFYPGAMSLDSVAQWLQVTDPRYLTTWHPPVMVYLWSFFNTIMPGTQGLLIFHYIIYFLSLYIFATIFFQKLIQRCGFILVLGLFPPIFFFNGVIWKDVSMLTSLSMSFALLFKFEADRKKIWFLLSICFLLYGAAVRHNAVICLPPYIIYVLTLFLENTKKKKKILLICVLTPLLFFGGVKLIRYANFGFVKESQIAYNMENSAFIWDLWVMSVELEKNIIPRYVFDNPKTNLSVKELKDYYVPYTASVLWLPLISRVKWQKPFPDKQFKRDFLKLVFKYPLAYLKVRTRIVLYMLGIKKPIILPYQFEIYKPWKKDDWLYEVSRNLELRNKKALHTAEKFAQVLLDKTPFYLLWVYFVLILLQFIGIFVYRDALGKHFRQSLLILTTGTTYWLPFIIISAAADFRYSVFVVYCSIIMLPLLVQSIFQHHKRTFSKNNDDHNTGRKEQQ